MKYNFSCIKCKRELKQKIPCCSKCFFLLYRRLYVRINKEYYKKYALNNKEKIVQNKRRHYLKNKERIKKRGKIRYKNKKNEIVKQAKKYIKKNYELVSKRKSEWYYKNAEKVKRRIYKRAKWKLKNDIEYKIKNNIISRIRVAIKQHKGIKHTSSIRLLGASIDIVRKYIENQFQEGMTWENYGLKGWHIDHIIPCSAFDLTDQEQQKKCFHYTNLQPLWWKDNIKKGAKIV